MLQLETNRNKVVARLERDGWAATVVTMMYISTPQGLGASSCRVTVRYRRV